MSATIHFLPGALEARMTARERKARAQPAPSCARTEDEKAILTRVLILQITLKMGRPMTAEQHGYLHRYGHLAP